MSRLSWKLVVLGGLAYYAVTWILSFITGPLIHNGLLKPTYREHAALWRPELNQDPPDMAALLPRWILTGLIASLIVAAVYAWIRPVFSAPGWKRGLQYGLVLWLIGLTFGLLGYSGVFNAPDKIWIVWSLEGLLYFLLGGAVLGLVGDKVAPAPA